MTTLGTYGVGQKQCPFLTLPGELRNEIYSYILGNLQRNSTAIRPIRVTERPSLFCDFQGLTQTCQTTRNEFLPLWLKSRHIAVSLDRVPKYFETFILPQGDLDQAIANMTITNMTIARQQSTLPLQGTDILPAMRLISSNQVKIRVNKSSQYTLLTLRLASEYAKFKPAVDAGLITGVWVSPVPVTNPFTAQHAYRFIQVIFTVRDEEDVPVKLGTIEDLDIWEDFGNLYIPRFAISHSGSGPAALEE
ncbi:hypothetical protein K491DRAFT_763562 [Lophiostoma macrostomum CBS 122681]|uniref:Uncharacterized protein n=1 Tax=Lophiostoma macrostomum CBS 122681 TaxID=1314788 RepID=A0A6A6SIP7_9PLEO|nr:hypothetical protein K491DRAFT_763562 [Lophiostoma macrostomum CBS 122681]